MEEGLSISCAAFQHPRASPRTSGRVESATACPPWTFPCPRNASIVQRALALPLRSHGRCSKCCLVPSMDLQGNERPVPHPPPAWCPQDPQHLYLGELLETSAPFPSLEILFETLNKHLTDNRNEMPVLR